MCLMSSSMFALRSLRRTSLSFCRRSKALLTFFTSFLTRLPKSWVMRTGVFAVIASIVIFVLHILFKFLTRC
ncbi:hypothetical protein ATCV1_z090L [Acanthocystis turfacea chlorella virus 1]|uniref:Uncharacterized protein z090L n=1 Tax=Chlorovirus heliozoae TaxID=322019 RepID=A7K850_9PHYC|nr:hypothetical protein ATCV1_z090L [Acanthocystis turfacea chlorella virus 1]ABT16224.1 hypothetical protein ATCV1_z090L [Acanthocystis turfacea chlorella virus 1]